MTGVPDLDGLAREWQAMDWPGSPDDRVRRYVRTRSRLLMLWVVGEGLVGAVALPWLLYLAWTMPAAGDRVAMLSLALVVVMAVAAGWWNWRDVLGHRAESTAAFLDLSLRRLQRVRWALRAGVITLLAEVAIFGTWIASRPGSSVFGWTLLLVMAAGGVGFLLTARRWLDREARRLDSLRREVVGEDRLE